MRLLHAAAALIVVGSCAGHAQRARTTVSDSCPMLKAVLHAVIMPQDDDIHLRTACVQQYAATAGMVWVDARFFDQAAQPLVPKDCRIPGYQVRLGNGLDPKPPGETILLVSISEQTNRQSHFFAQIENTDWSTRRPNTYASSACGSVSGTITQVGSKTQVQIVPAAPSDLQ